MVRQIPTPIAIAGKVLVCLNLLIAILAFWLVLDPSFRMCDTVSEDGTHVVENSQLGLSDLSLLVAALVGFLLPLFAFVRAWSSSRDNRCLDWSLGTVALIGALFWAGMIYSNSAPNTGLVFLPTLPMMLGCLFALIVFFVHGSSWWRNRFSTLPLFSRPQGNQQDAESGPRD